MFWPPLSGHATAHTPHSSSSKYRRNNKEQIDKMKMKSLKEKATSLILKMDNHMFFGSILDFWKVILSIVLYARAYETCAYNMNFLSRKTLILEGSCHLTK